MACQQLRSKKRSHLCAEAEGCLSDTAGCPRWRSSGCCSATAHPGWPAACLAEPTPDVFANRGLLSRSSVTAGAWVSAAGAQSLRRPARQCWCHENSSTWNTPSDQPETAPLAAAHTEPSHSASWRTCNELNWSMEPWNGICQLVKAMMDPGCQLPAEPHHMQSLGPK